MEKEKATDEDTALVMELGSAFLIECANENIPPNLAQAALGHAWMSLCIANGYTLEEFKGLCAQMIESFEEYNKINKFYIFTKS